MILDVESVAKSKLNGKEELYWFGQPVVSTTVKTLVPVLFVLLAFAIVLFIYAAYVLVVDLIIAYSAGQLRSGMVFQPVRDIVLASLAGVFFLVFRYLLPRNFYTENNTIYAITSHRALIIQRDEKVYDKFNVTEQWGAGDIKKAHKKMRGKTNGDIWFAEDFLSIGEDEESKKSKSPTWRGFTDVEDVNKAFSEMKKWQKTRTSAPYKLVNEGLGFIIEKLPADWTANTFMIKKEHRDNTFFGIISGEVMDDDGQLLYGTSIGKKWNTLVLTKRHSTTRKEGTGRHSYLTILIDAALREEIPQGEKMFRRSQEVKLQSFFTNKNQLFDMMRKTTMIFEFDKPCEKDKKTKKFKLRRNADANPMKEPKNTLKNYEMRGNLKIMTSGFQFKQIYSYKVIPWEPPAGNKMCLHIRTSFLCYTSEKDKVFNGNHNKINDIVNSIKIIGEKEPEAKEAPKK